MPYDNLCKYLSERYPERFASWVTGTCCESVAVLKNELGNDPIQADSLTLLQTRDCILHLEFQVHFPTEPPIPLRMLDYWVRLYRKYRIPVIQVLVALKNTPAARHVVDEFCVGETRHRYRIIRLWEQEPESFFDHPALYPLATLARADSPTKLLKMVAETIETVDNCNERRELSTCAQILAGLRNKKELIRKIFKEDIMRESVIYQEILHEGIERGIERGIEQGIERGIERGIEQGRWKGELSILINLFTSRWGKLPSPLLKKINELPVERLEELSRVAFMLNSPAELADWMQKSS